MSAEKKQRRPFRAIVPMLVGFGTIVLLLGGFATWAAVAEIDGAIVATGRKVVDRNRQAVQHPEGGVIEDILVKEGDTVSEGQLLIRLDPEALASELKIVEGQLFELIARRGRLEAERDEAEKIVFDPFLVDQAAENRNVALLMNGQKRLFVARRESLKQSITQFQAQRLQLEEQVGGINAQEDAIERQLTLVGTETAAQKVLLDKGLAQTSRVLSLQREDARLAGARGDLVSRRAQAQERMAELEIQILKMKSQRRENAISILRDLQFNELEMAERRKALLVRMQHLDIRAPIAGIIYDMRVHGRRSIIRPADPILYLIPQDRALIIEAQVDPNHVDDVYAKQDVVLRFRAFDTRTTPDLIGSVSRVSPDAFIDPQTGRSYYRIEIELPKEEMSKLTPDQVLLPGMPVDTFIRTGEHSPLTYLTSPLTRYFQKAMRDEG